MKRRFDSQSLKKISISLMLVILCSFCFAKAKTHENWQTWDVTYYDYSDQETHKLFQSVLGKIDTLEQARGYQGTSNPLLRELKGFDTLYSCSLYFWHDYLKFTLCSADGIEYLSDEEIKSFNEIFDTLNIFAKDFYNGKYTNGIEPSRFSFITEKLMNSYTGVNKSLEKINRHVNIEKYLSNPNLIPELSKNPKKSNNGGIVFLIILLILVVLIVIGYINRKTLMKNEKIASVISTIKMKIRK